jgi:hypothetical protein
MPLYVVSGIDYPNLFIDIDKENGLAFWGQKGVRAMTRNYGRSWLLPTRIVTSSKTRDWPVHHDSRRN